MNTNTVQILTDLTLPEKNAIEKINRVIKIVAVTCLNFILNFIYIVVLHSTIDRSLSLNFISI